VLLLSRCRDGLGVPYALALGLFVGVVAAFIPIVGTYIAGAVPVLVAWPRSVPWRP
jgi:predicted PurR-regulated permease PerM